MVKLILIKSPDEWATTKEVYRDELEVYLFFPVYAQYIYTQLYFYVLSTVSQKSKFAT